MVARLREMMLASTRIFADETVVPVLDPGRGRTKTGHTSGRLRVTIAHGAAASHPRWFTATRLAGGISTPTRCSVATAASCSAMATGPTRSSPAPNRPRLSATLAFCWSHNLELVFMWSGGPGPRHWPVATAGGTPDKFDWIRVTGGTREGRASASRLLPRRARSRHAPRTSPAHHASFAGSW